MRCLGFALLFFMSFCSLDCCDFSVCRGIKGSGIEMTEERALSPFESVDIRGAYDVSITCRQEQSVTITGDDNILPHIVTRIRGKTLIVESNESISPEISLELNITVGNVESVKTSGAIDVTISDMENQKIEIDINGAGGVRAAGTTRELAVTISGAATLNTKDLLSEDAAITINGTGSAEVFASRKLEAEINGAGNIGYYGNPTEVAQDVSGVGSISKKG